DRLGDFLAQVGFRRLFQLRQNHGGNLRRRVFLAHDLHARVAIVAGYHLVRHQLHFLVHFVEATAHEAFDGIHGVLGVGDRLPFCDLPDQPLAVLGEGDHGWSGASALLIGDDYRLATFHDGHHGVRGPQVYAYDFAHLSDSSRMPLHAREFSV